MELLLFLLVLPAGEPGVRLRDEARALHGADHDERRRPEVPHPQHRRPRPPRGPRALLRRGGVLRVDAPAPERHLIPVSGSNLSSIDLYLITVINDIILLIIINAASLLFYCSDMKPENILLDDHGTFNDLVITTVRSMTW